MNALWGGGEGDEWLTMPSQQVVADERFNIFSLFVPGEGVKSV
jgi:hypothetical protein